MEAPSDAEYLARSLHEPTAFEPIFDRHFGAVHRYDFEVYVMNADGSGQQNLTRNPVPDRSPVWSPGRKGS